MAVLSVRKFGDLTLNEKSFFVKELDSEVEKLVKDLGDTLTAVSGVGLAASQLGILKKIFVIDLGNGPEAYINAEVVSGSEEEKEEEEEGCLSVPGIKVPIKRFKKIRVKALNLKGKAKEFEAEGFFSRVIQHEIDHTEGILILDRLKKPERRKALAELRKASLDENYFFGNTPIRPALSSGPA